MRNSKADPRHYLTIFVAATTLLVAARPGARAAKPTVRPNVVIILTDDQGTLDAACFGSADLDTPAIDALADLPTRCTVLPNDVEAVREFIVRAVG